VNSPDSDSCLDLETLSAFGEGTLDKAAFASVSAHVSRCSRCRTIVARAAAVEHERLDEQSHPALRWVAIAAGVILVVIATPVLRSRRPRETADPIVLLASVAPKSSRNVEARLSGGFPWAPYRDNRAAGTSRKPPDQLIAGGAASKILRDLDRDRSAHGLHVKGVASLITDDPPMAMRQLEDSARLAPGDAATQSDLAAGIYSGAGDDNAALAAALTAADRAIQLDPKLTEAYFNRALVLERLGRKDQARAAWEDYLRRDSSTGWAREARDHLAAYGAVAN
jgi:hypothetical protein